MELTTQIEDVTVKGRIILSTPFSLKVEITRPYQGFEKGISSSYPYSVSPYSSREFYRKDRERFRGEQKEESASTMLQELHEICHYLEQNREKLASDYGRCKRDPDFPADDGHVRFLKQRSKLRKQFKAGLITEKEYQQQLKEIRKTANERRVLFLEKPREFFTNSFPMSLSDALQAQIIKILESDLAEKTHIPPIGPNPPHSL